MTVAEIKNKGFRVLYDVSLGVAVIVIAGLLMSAIETLSTLKTSNAVQAATIEQHEKRVTGIEAENKELRSLVEGTRGDLKEIRTKIEACNDLLKAHMSGK